MKCKHCGYTLDADARFCPECGQKVVVMPDNMPAIHPTKTIKESFWYFVENGGAVGPLPTSEIKHHLQTNRINEESLVWKDGLSQWIPLKDSDLKELIEIKENTVSEPQKEEIVSEPEQTEEPTSSASWYYVDNNSEQQGPFPEEQIKEFLNAQTIDEQTFVWTEGLDQWIPLKDSDLKGLIETKENTASEPHPEETVSEPEQTVEPTSSASWYYVDNSSEQQGPCTINQMKDLLNNKTIDAQTFVWTEGLDQWICLKDSDLKDLIEVKEDIPTAPKQEKEPEVIASWYYVDNNSEQQGPCTIDQMKDLLNNKAIHKRTFVWTDGLETWKPLDQTELSKIIPVPKSTVSSTAISNPIPSGIENKNIIICMLFSAVTCMIYGYYWLYCLVRDTNKLLISQGKKPGTDESTVILYSIITCGIYQIYYEYKLCKLLSSMEFDQGFKVADNSIICLVLSLFRMDIISYAIMQDAINVIIQDK